MAVLQKLGYTTYIGFGGDEPRRFHSWWTQKVPSGYVKKFFTQEEAFNYLKRAVASDRLPMMVVNYSYIMKVLAPEWSDLDEPKHMGVTEYDKNFVI